MTKKKVISIQMMRKQWITFAELAQYIGISLQTLSNYLARAEFDIYTNFERKKENNQFYVCFKSTNMLAELLKKRQRYLPAKNIKILGEEFCARTKE